MVTRFQAEANRLIDQLRTFTNNLTVIQTYLYEVRETTDYQRISFVTTALVNHEDHMLKLVAEMDKHEPGHLWAELNRTRNQLIYQLTDVMQVFIKFTYLFVQNKIPKEKE